MDTGIIAEAASANEPVRPKFRVPSLDAHGARLLFDRVTSLEGAVGTVTDLLRSMFILAMSEAIEDDRDRSALLRLIALSEDAVGEIEAGRRDLFDGLHPFAFGAEVTSLREGVHG